MCMAVDMSDDDDNMSTDEQTVPAKVDTELVEVLDVVYDKNGTKHKAVKQRYHQLSDGGLRLHPSRCRSKGCSAKTRVKCLECGLSYCYPIRLASTVSRTNNCFTNHVHNIPKLYSKSNMSYADLSGRR